MALELDKKSPLFGSVLAEEFLIPSYWNPMVFRMDRLLSKIIEPPGSASTELPDGGSA